MGSSGDRAAQPMMNQDGRVVTPMCARPTNSRYIQGQRGQYLRGLFPIENAGKHVVIHDPKTNKTMAVDTCSAPTSPVGADKDNTICF